jgi:hypothetical protein
VVRLCPNQDFVIFLPTIEANYNDLCVQSHFFRLTQTTLHSFKFSQIADLSSWTAGSRVYLGDVLLDVQNHRPVSNLSVILEGEQKNAITVVNPIGNQLKVDVNQLIEVVICGAAIEECNCSIVVGEKMLRCVEIKKLVIQKDKPSQVWFEGSRVVTRCLDDNTSFVEGVTDGKVEHHFWFRFSPASFKIGDDLKEGEYNAGKLMFDVKASNMISVYNVYELNLLLKVKKKCETIPFNQVVKPLNKSRTIFPTTTTTSKVITVEEEYKPRKVNLVQKGGGLDVGCYWVYEKDFVPRKHEDDDFITISGVKYRKAGVKRPYYLYETDVYDCCD